MGGEVARAAELVGGLVHAMARDSCDRRPLDRELSRRTLERLPRTLHTPSCVSFLVCSGRSGFCGTAFDWVFGIAAGDHPHLATDGTLSYDNRGDYAGVEGVLQSEQAGGALCVYVDSTAGPGRGRVNLVFPAGYSAVGDRVVRDAEETIVASKGRRVLVSTMPELSKEAPAGCSSAGVGTARALHLEQVSE